MPTRKRSDPICPRSGELGNVPISFLAVARPEAGAFRSQATPTGAPTAAASPRLLVHLWQESRDSMVCQEAGPHNLAIPTTQRKWATTHLLAHGNEAADRGRGGGCC